MNSAKKILINSLLITCLFSWYNCSSSKTCAIYDGDCACDSEDAELRAFSREEWHKYPFESNEEQSDFMKNKEPKTFLTTRRRTRCIREAMICDLTQNVIPLGTPYEEVVSLLGNGSIWSRLPGCLRGDYKYFYLYSEDPSELIAKKKVLIYTSGGSISGDSYLLIIFENEKVIGFARAIES